MLAAADDILALFRVEARPLQKGMFSCAKQSLATSLNSLMSGPNFVMITHLDFGFTLRSLVFTISLSLGGDVVVYVKDGILTPPQ